MHREIGEQYKLHQSAVVTVAIKHAVLPIKHNLCGYYR